jgi:cystathionine beta-lyase/cystathionine gamma-synthase
MVPLNPKGIFIGEGYHGVHRCINFVEKLTHVEKLTLNHLDQLGHGADIFMHSGTKYVGDYSDMLCGLLVLEGGGVKRGWLEKLQQHCRTSGAVMGSLEAWLGIRSLRTLELRVTRQSATETALATWLLEEIQDSNCIIGKTVDKVAHASLQHDDLKNGWLKKQMPNGFGPVISMWMKREDHARRLPSRMFVFSTCY